jgi:molybdenum cofactor biosynthesis enzyme MoaA
VINQRLFDWYGVDTQKNLRLNTYCSRPYDTVLIDKTGGCFLCECTSWLPQSVGNLHKQPIESILESALASELRSSIADGSYRYCNNKQCSYLLNKSSKLWPNTIPTNQIKNIRLAIDDSCNLRCPSCRKGLIFIKEGKNFDRRIKLANKINDWLRTITHPVKVHIGSDGDPFASHVYRHFMTHTPICKNIKYSLLTNGLMFQDFSNKVPHIIENLDELGISIDGASQTTYENLRLGGSWKKINSNLKFISELKKKHNFIFRLHFVVQKDNYHEMEDIISLGKKYKADRVWLNKLENWNVIKNFQNIDIFNSTHPLHKDYQKKLKKIQTYLDVTKTSPIVEIPTLNIE